MVPALLLLLARDLLLHDPVRVLAWRLLHDPRLAGLPPWLAALLPRTAPGFDRDPIALLLAGLATGFALLYLGIALFGAAGRWRAAVLGLAVLVLVGGPTAAFVAMGLATDRPYGQDGGVVQLPLAMDKILAGESPYGADYSDTILGRQARASAFWEPFGGNPILRHHAYLPGTHALMLPFHLASRAALGAFDPRVATVLAFALGALLAARLVEGPDRRLAAAGLVALNPLVYWHQIFGANDMLFVAALLACVWAAGRGRTLVAGVLLGLACATKQLAWPFAPFLLLDFSGARGWRELGSRATWARALPPAGAALATFVIVVAPVALLDLAAFYGDIVAYNVGLPGDNYPLGGTPGFGFANFLIYFGGVKSLGDYFPFGAFYVLLLPLGLVLARAQLRDPGPGRALLNGSVALLASLYFSRVVHPNYLIPLAVLLPLALLVRGRGADAAIVPLALLAAAVELVENALLRASFDQAVGAGLLRTLDGAAALLRPRAEPGLTADPMGAGLSALAAGLALLYLAAAALGASARLRFALGTIAAGLVVFLPTTLMAGAWGRTGIRGQDRWVVQAPADAARLASGRSPYAKPPPEAPTGREAWSTSFRLEPPRRLEPDRPLLPPGAAVLALAPRLVGARDPRVLTLLGLVLLIAALARALPREQRPLALGALVLAPPMALGTVFGAPSVVTLCLLACAAGAAARPSPIATGLLAGAAAATDALAWPAAALLLLAAVRARGFESARGALAAASLAFAALCLPAAALGPAAFTNALVRPPDLSPGLGAWNAVLYLGAEHAPPARLALALVPAAAAAGVALAGRAARRAAPAALGALVVLIVLFLDAGTSPEAVALPLGLLVTACLDVRPASPDYSAPSRDE